METKEDYAVACMGSAMIDYLTRKDQLDNDPFYKEFNYDKYTMDDLYEESYFFLTNALVRNRRATCRLFKNTEMFLDLEPMFYRVQKKFKSPMIASQLNKTYDLIKGNLSEEVKAKLLNDINQANSFVNLDEMEAYIKNGIFEEDELLPLNTYHKITNVFGFWNDRINPNKVDTTSDNWLDTIYTAFSCRKLDLDTTEYIDYKGSIGSLLTENEDLYLYCLCINEEDTIKFFQKIYDKDVESMFSSDVIMLMPRLQQHFKSKKLQDLLEKMFHKFEDVDTEESLNDPDDYIQNALNETREVFK